MLEDDALTAPALDRIAAGVDAAARGGDARRTDRRLRSRGRRLFPRPRRRSPRPPRRGRPPAVRRGRDRTRRSRAPSLRSGRYRPPERIDRSTRSASCSVIRVPMPVSAEPGSPVLISTHPRNQCIEEVARDLRVGDDALHGDAHLAGVDESTESDGHRGRVDVGVGEHDHGARRAQLEREAFFTPASWVMRVPTRVDPVNEILLTRESPTKACPRSPPGPVSTDRTPSGSPASTKHAARARAVNGVVRAGLSTTALPAARAGATLCRTSSGG